MNMKAYAVRVGELFIGTIRYYDSEMTGLVSELAHARLFTEIKVAEWYTEGEIESIINDEIQYTAYTGGRVVTVEVTAP